MAVDAHVEPAMGGRGGRHRRRDEDTAGAVQQYELLLRLLFEHRPAQRSGLCLVCGIGWPCVEVRVAAGARH